MKDVEIIKYKITNVLTKNKIDFQIHNASDNFKIGFSLATWIICKKCDDIVFKYSSQGNGKVQIEFEEQFSDVENLLIYLEHHILLKSDSYFSKEFVITAFIKYHLGINDFFVHRRENGFSGKRYIDITFEKTDTIHIAIDEDKYEIKNWGIASEIEWGFFDVEPILVSADLDDVLLFLKENYTATK